MGKQIDEKKETLLKIIEEFEERLDKFNKDIDDQNIMHILVKAHLYVEFELEKLLLNFVKYPEHIKLEHMKFSQKQNLVLALGLVPIKERNSLKHLNKIRNDIAHNLEYEFDARVLDDLIQQFSIENKEKYKKDIEYFYEEYGISLESKLRCVVSIIWGNLIEIRVIPPNIRRELDIIL